jgi:sRNA-binding protein
MTDTATPQEIQEVREVQEDASAPQQQQQPRAGKGRRPRRGPQQQQQQQQQPGEQKPRQPQQQQQPNQQARSRKVHPALEKLFALYPKMFGAQFLPLKLGVYQDLLAQHPDDFKKDDLKVALGLHARSTRYLEAVAAGHQRHDLQGVPVEPVAPEHVHHAILEVFKRRQARSNEDLRPRVVTRIIAAIESSGLGRDAYAERVRTQDEATNALLDEAVAELGRQAAKREALFRAFTASGRSEAEFADMYGMDPAEVARTLARVRSDQAQAAAASVAAAASDQATAAAEAPADE